MKRLPALALPALALPALALSALALAAPLTAQGETPVTPGSVVAAAPAEDWVAIAPDDLLVMELAPDAEDNPRRVIIQLMPPPFSQGWVENIRMLAKARWWDGTNIYRVQDDYVTQWGGSAVDKEDPEGLNVVPESEYSITGLFLPEIAAPRGLVWQDLAFFYLRNALVASNEELAPPAGFEEALEASNIEALPDSEFPRFPDPYANISSHILGWPVASSMPDSGLPRFWPLHCYGMVGVARGLDNTGSGSNLYAVIGHAPRQLDRNIALVGRVIEGIEHLSSLPRGKGELGFYEDGEAQKRVPILSVRLGSEPVKTDPSSEAAGQQGLPRFEYLSTESHSFAAYLHARANRQDDFYKVPAGGVDVCNAPVPVRRMLEQ